MKIMTVFSLFVTLLIIKDSKIQTDLYIIQMKNINIKILIQDEGMIENI